jgi:hypothetical protein
MNQSAEPQSSLRIAIWCAVSSKQQADKTSLDDQERLGRDPALSNQVYSLVEKSRTEVCLHTAPHTVG